MKELISKILKEYVGTINESITLHGVTLSAANSKHGGPILTKYKDITNKYSVTVDTPFYDGPVGVKYIYKKDIIFPSLRESNISIKFVSKNSRIERYELTEICATE